MRPDFVRSGSERSVGSRLPPWVTRWVRPRRCGPTEEARREGGRAPGVVASGGSYSMVDRVRRPRRGRGG